MQPFKFLQSMPGFRIPSKFLAILWMLSVNYMGKFSRDTSRHEAYDHRGSTVNWEWSRTAEDLLLYYVLLWEIIPTHSSLRKWQSRFDPRNGRADNVAKTGMRKVSLIGWNFCAKIQKPSNNQSERPQLSVVLRHQHMIFRIESLSLLRFFPREDRPACIQTAASHHRTILPYHLTVCSSTLRRFVFSVENKMHS